MYSNDTIIKELKQSLFQDDENAFNKLFSPFVQEINSDEVDFTGIKDKIVIKDEKKINFFIENKSENKETDSDDEKMNDDNDDSSDDVDDDDDYQMVTQSHIATSGNKHKISRLTSSTIVHQTNPINNNAKTKSKPKAKSKAKLKKKIVML